MRQVYNQNTWVDPIERTWGRALWYDPRNVQSLKILGPISM